MSLLRQLVSPPGERREASLDNTLKALVEGRGWTTWAGVSVTERSALQLLTVYSCVSLISDTISTLPIGRFRKVEGAPQRLPDAPWMVKPHAEWEWNEWLGAGMYADLLLGNAYAEVIDRDTVGVPIQMQPLHPDECEPVRRDGQLKYRVARKGGRETLDPINILHVRGLRAPGVNSLKGLSPIEHARQAMGLGLAAQEFGARFFGDGANPSGVLSVPKDLKPEDAKRYKELWKETFGQRTRDPAVLGGGMEWKAISITPEEAQFLETRGFVRTDICGFFRVAPHMIAIVEKSTSWGSGIEEQVLGFIMFTLQPWIERWEAKLSALLPRPQYVKFNLAGLLRGRLLDRYKSYLTGRQGGWLCIDEIRAKEDMAPLPDGKGQDYLTPLNFGPIPPGGLVTDPGGPAADEPEP